MTIVWAIGYWILYPAWPLLWSHTTGIWNYSTRAEVATELANLEKIRGDKMVALGAAPLEEIEKNPALLALARARGKTVFGDNCAPCHGSGGAGAKGYPNLNDDEWLWGGSLDQIMQTIQFGARSGHPKTHESAMLAFGKEGVLKKDQIVTVANYVRSLSGLPTAAGYDAAAGKKIFADNCTSCLALWATRARRARSHRQNLVSARRGDAGRDHPWPARHARLGRPARSLHDQGADGLCHCSRRK
jgi:cytochrome c oxidase cbb3-type subunit 3